MEKIVANMSRDQVRQYCDRLSLPIEHIEQRCQIISNLNLSSKDGVFWATFVSKFWGLFVQKHLQNFQKKYVLSS